MESLNKVELIGTVGTVNSQKVSNSTVTRFSVVTAYAHKLNDGTPVIDDTWHNCVSFDDKAELLRKGDTVKVEGRIRNQRYTDADGNNCQYTEIVVNKLLLLSN